MNNKILIVDDHLDIRKLLRVTFANKFEILEAEDGETALAITRAHQPRVVLLDVMMAGEMDGFQVLQAIKSDAALQGVRVVMLTARGQQRDYDLASGYGAERYVAKPFSPSQLLTIVTELM